jgi:hypothetical protein
VNALKNPLADGTIGDPHYTLTAVPSGTTEIRVRTSIGGYPISPWSGDNSLSAWIGPNNDGQVDGDIGTYLYRTTFDLTGLNPLTASLTISWSTDNDGLDVLLNNASTGQTTAFEQFSSGFSTFTLNSGFVAGLNTLDFKINNGGGPTGLRTEIAGTADTNSPVPEPISFVLLGVGLGTIGLFRRRKA